MKALVIILPLLAIQPASAGSDSFVARCQKMAGDAQILAVFEDRPVTQDSSRGLETLKALSQAGGNANPYHRVLGLTHAEPAVSLESTTHLLVDGDGSVCAVPSVSLRLGFSVLEVYLAKELTSPCHRAVIARHEEEHVTVWRNHLRAGAQMLTVALRAKLGQPAYFRNQEQARAELPQQVNAAIAPLLARLHEGINVSHREIDSALSYQNEENRLRACP